MQKTISRREFLKGSAASAIGVAAAGLFGASAFAEEGTYTPGTYTASAQGMDGPVTATVTFDETSIVDVILDVSGETPGIGAEIGDEMAARILEAQGVNIDGVSGASVTSNAIREAVTDCINQAGGNVVFATAEEAPAQEYDPSAIQWPINEPAENYTPVAAGEGVIAYELDPIDESKIVDEQDVDVLVCGFGPSGIAAALSSAQRGLKTIVIEKNDTGTINSMTIGGLHDRIHKMYGVEFDENEILGEAMTKNGYRGNQAIYKRLNEINGEAVDWWLDQMPFEDEQYPLTFFGYSGVEFDFREKYDPTARDHSWNTSINIPFGSPAEMLAHLEGKVLEAGAAILYETPVVQLITNEDGAVVGAYGKNAEGYIKFNVAKGVVLATGGYEHNLKKLKECCRPRDLQLIAWLTYARNCTGDGHEMAKAIGAIEDEYPHPLMLDPMQLMPYVRVNSEGQRFIGEYETYDHLASAMQAQYGGYDFFITDANVMEAVDAMWSPSSSCYGPKEVWAGAATSPNALVADSLEELAELMGVPADAFVATINRWNEMCDSAEGDVDFGYPKEHMHRIDTAPFYATKEMAESLATSGGLQVNEDSQVLNNQNKPIEGLYSIGNCSGSMFYGTYPHSLNCLSHTRCIAFGWQIGKNLAEK